jgi:hypothetical protein
METRRFDRFLLWNGAAASFLLSKYPGKQRTDGQPNRPSAPESHSLFSAASGLKMGTSSPLKWWFYFAD